MEFVADALDAVDAALDDSRRRSRAVAASRATFYSGDHVSMDGESIYQNDATTMHPASRTPTWHTAPDRAHH